MRGENVDVMYSMQQHERLYVNKHNITVNADACQLQPCLQTAAGNI